MDRQAIMTAIISKGGLMGSIANLYIHDAVLSDKFIKECYEQCHNKSAKRMFGESVVLEIQKYVLNPHRNI